MCADAYLDEKNIKMMVRCIRLDRDCVKICHTTSIFVASDSDYSHQLINQCEEICRARAEECERYKMGHCQECARACRQCEEACKSFSGVGV